MRTRLSNSWRNTVGELALDTARCLHHGCRSALVQGFNLKGFLHYYMLLVMHKDINVYSLHV